MSLISWKEFETGFLPERFTTPTHTISTGKTGPGLAQTIYVFHDTQLKMTYIRTSDGADDLWAYGLIDPKTILEDYLISLQDD